MYQPNVHITRNVAPEVDMFGTFLPAGPLGYLPVNAFLLRSREPVLVDTGVAVLELPTMQAIRELIEPTALKWIYLTHVDGDHVGALPSLLDEAPNARIVTTFLGMAKLGLRLQISPERFYLLNPGQTLDVGDRRLLAGKPPTFDAPETTCLWDESSRTLFSSDCYGSPVSTPGVESVDDIPAAELEAGMITWTTVDAAWIHAAQASVIEAAAHEVLRLNPQTVLSAHLPPAKGRIEEFTQNILAGRTAPAFVGPDQAGLQQLMAAE